MPKQSYGPITQQRIQHLLMTLVDFANDALVVNNETKLDALRSQIQCHWQSNQRLVVRTKLRHLQELSHLAGQPILTIPQIKEALKILKTLVGILEDNRTQQRGSEHWHFTLTLWDSRWQRDTNLKCFAQAWEQNRRQLESCPAKLSPNLSPNLQETFPVTFPEKLPVQNVVVQAETVFQDVDCWQACCRTALNTRLTTNPLTAQDGMAFDLTEVYVPLGVQLRSQRFRDSPTTADWDEEVEPVYLPEALLSMLKSQSQPQRVAIIGEPGAGKTTFLQKLALGLLDDAEALPIWVALADLQGQSLETYLTQTWLQRSLQVLTVPLATVEAFVAEFRQGRVWLLLDAIDEIGLSSSVAFSQLAKQMQGWLAQAHILLTCRLNVWDAGKNALDDFVTYRCLGLSHPTGLKENPVQMFIQRWFQTQSGLALTLDAALHRPELRRVNDMVQNPLALALLCRTWALTEGKLPATKAGLYRQFVDALYNWKQDIFPTTRAQQQTLNQALARLALTALIESPQPWRWSQPLVERSFAAEGLSFWDLALQLGWLKSVGVSVQDGQTLYAFHHPTFQAYFAAQAITDWRLFLNQASEPRLSFTPIFESHWQEIILLWLGREDVTTAVKTAFLDAIATFEDYCGGFYRYRAYFLAAVGLAEFPDYAGANSMIATLVHWRFSQTPPSLSPILVEQAGIALLKSDRIRAIAALESFVQASTHWIERWLAAYSLGKIYDPGNQIAIATLETLLAEDLPLSLQINIAKSLGVIDPGNSVAIHGLEAILHTNPAATVQRKVAYRLGQIDPGNALAIQTLAMLLATVTDPYLRKITQQSLDQIAPNYSVLDPVISPTLDPELQLGLDPGLDSAVHPSKPSRPNQFRQPGLEDDQLLEILLQKFNTTPDAATQVRIAGRLGQVEATYALARDRLVHLLKTCDRKSLLRQASEQLRGLTTTYDPQRPLPEHRLESTLPLIQAIYQMTATESDPRYHECFRLLWYWSQMISYEKFVALWNDQ